MAAHQRNRKRIYEKSAAFLLMFSTFAVHGQISHAAEQNQDATFNGTIIGVPCYISEVIGCSNEFCQLVLGPFQGDSGGTLEVNFRDGRYRIGATVEPLEVLGVSKAELNEPLWVKFKVILKDKAANMMLILRPRGGGGYQPPSLIGTFHVDKGEAIETFDCSLRQ